MELQNIITNTASIAVPFFGETLNVKYRPAVVTPDSLSKVDNMGDNESFVGYFVELIAGWDLTRGGVAVEVTVEEMSGLPMQLLRQTLTLIMEDVPQGEAGKVSSDT